MISTEQIWARERETHVLDALDLEQLGEDEDARRGRGLADEVRSGGTASRLCDEDERLRRQDQGRESAARALAPPLAPPHHQTRHLPRAHKANAPVSALNRNELLTSSLGGMPKTGPCGPAAGFLVATAGACASPIV